LRADVS
jgi:hypothetical protein